MKASSYYSPPGPIRRDTQSTAIELIPQQPKKMLTKVKNILHDGVAHLGSLNHRLSRQAKEAPAQSLTVAFMTGLVAAFLFARR